MIETALVVLHYNKIRLTRNCLQSILEANYPPRQIYCFDNGSQPEVFQQLKHDFPLIHHERIEENLGFSGGFNRAMEWVFSTGVSAVLFCTNDTLVEPGALEACTETARQTKAGMVAPLITFVSNPDTVDSIGAFFNAETGTLHHYHEYDLPPILDPQRDYIPGTAWWIEHDTFKELGGTDESYHMFWEDVDLCFRAHGKGIPLARCYNAVIRHAGGQTTRKKPLYTTFYFQRNRIRFCKRYLQGAARDKVLNKIHRELLASESQWKQKGDLQRLDFLEQLLKEFPEQFSC